ncbi:SCO family protein [Sphingomonas jatrophae]|nr:SCO family protein [Sphingomonas jatrophae]
MNKAPFLAALLPLALLVAGCDRAAPVEEAPLAGAKLGGPFALTDQDGRAVTDRSFAGRYRLVYFGYTYCPDVCPTSLQVLMGGYHQFAKASPDAAKKVVPILVTVDPERDTPAVMKQYVAAFGPELVGLTGTPAAIADAARRYGVSYGKRQDEGASGYLMDHVSAAILFGPAGEPIALVPQDGTRDQVAAELAKWVR